MSYFTELNEREREWARKERNKEILGFILLLISLPFIYLFVVVLCLL